jgi:DNA sulfur modification protein DndC
MGKDGASEDTEGLSDRKLRDFRRMNGNVQFMGEGENRRVIPGPYTQEARKNWLKMLLDAQSYIQSTGPKEVRDIELVTIHELEEIRRIWVFEKGEIEDFLPIIYQSSLGKKYPGKALGVNTFFDLTDLNSLKQICKDKDATYELCRDILTVISKRIFSTGKGQTQDELVNVLNRYLFASEKEAMDQERLVLNQNHESSKPKEDIIVV